jgi:flagellar biosynthetic protein FlhB
MERTEAPTSRRLGEARQRGQVPRSIELNAAIALLVGFYLLRSVGVRLLANLQNLLTETLTSGLAAEVTGGWVRGKIVREVARFAPDVATLAIGMAATGVIVTLAQTGPLWASKNIGFDFGRLNPLNGLRRLFSGQGLEQLGRALLKLAVVGTVAYLFLSGQIKKILLLGQLDLMSAVTHWAQLAYDLAFRVGGTYLVLAAADYFYQRWHTMRALRMTKQEVKDEAKQSEGDPFLKGRIRGQQRRMARQRMLARVPKADVVITNPTHFAVALQYDKVAMRAPHVVAKGSALVAQRIKTVALDNDVPVIENPPVARALYAAVEIDDEIPAELYRAVAEVLAFVYNLKNRQPSAVSLQPPLTSAL